MSLRHHHRSSIRLADPVTARVASAGTSPTWPGSVGEAWVTEAHVRRGTSRRGGGRVVPTPLVGWLGGSASEVDQVTHGMIDLFEEAGHMVGCLIGLVLDR